MALTNPQYGDDQQGWIKAESTFDTDPTFAATNAFQARAITITDPDRNRTDPGDNRNTFSSIERVEGRQEVVPWSVTVLLRPSAALGTVSQMGPFLTMLFGTQTINASTSVVYTQLKDRGAVSGFMREKMTDIHRHASGCICNSLVMRFTGGDYVTFEFSGEAARYGETGTDAADGAGSLAMALIVDDADFFDINSLIQIDGSGTPGILVTAVDDATEALTIASRRTWSDGDVVSPWMEAFTPVAGDPIYGTKGSVSLDGGSSTINFLEYTLTITNGMTLHNREGGNSYPTAIVNGPWSFSGSLTYVMEALLLTRLSHARRKVQKDLRFIIGDTAAKRIQVDLDQVEFDPTDVPVGNTGLVEVNQPFTALGSSGEDNGTLTFN